MTHRTPFLALMLMILFYGAHEARAQEAEKVSEPIKCWWKTDKSTIRLGEKFEVILTCQVVETDLERVVPQEGDLEPSAISFVPYTSIEGVRYPDIRRKNFRFFQYKYDLRLMGEDFFGKEVSIPTLEVKYRIDRKVQKESINTKENIYRLPELPMKVSSLVPKDTKDIRDSNHKTFGTIKELRFKATFGFVLAGLFLILPLAVMSLPFWRAILVWKRSSSNGTLFGNTTLLRRMLSELKYIKSLRSKSGWNSEVVGKVMTVCRIAGAIALSKNVNQLSEKFEEKGLEGQLKLRKGWRWPKKVMISSNLTPETMRANVSAVSDVNGKWSNEFIGVFEVFNDARYSPDHLDEARLDTYLVRCMSLVNELRYRHFWLVRKSLAVSAKFKEWRPQWSRIR